MNIDEVMKLAGEHAPEALSQATQQLNNMMPQVEKHVSELKDLMDKLNSIMLNTLKRLENADKTR